MLGLNYLTSPRPVSVSQTTSASQTMSATQETISSNPLSISDYAWTPLRLHEADLSFTAQGGNSSVTSANLKVTPYIPPELSAPAFPTEDPQEFALAPTSQSNARTIFTQEVSLKGGKSYKVNVKVKTADEETVELTKDSPYVREFDAENSQVLAGAYYLPWVNLKRTDPDVMPSLPFRHPPLLGLYGYQDNDPILISKHIDWSTGHRISHWSASWFGPYDSRLDQIFSNQLVDDIKIGLTFDVADLFKTVMSDYTPTVNVDDSDNFRILSTFMQDISSKYFSLPSYWKVNGKPFVFLYYSRYYTGDVPNAVGQLRDIAQNNGFKPFMVSGDVYLTPSPYWAEDNVKAYDALSAHTIIPNPGANVTNQNYENELPLLFKNWSKRGKLIPVASVGYGNRADPPSYHNYLDRDPVRFAKRIHIAKSFIDPQLNIMMIGSFNDIPDDSQLEPTQAEGWVMLETAKENL